MCTYSITNPKEPHPYVPDDDCSADISGRTHEDDKCGEGTKTHSMGT